MSERFCGNCGAPIAAAARFCPSCGADQERFLIPDKREEGPSAPTPATTEAPALSGEATRDAPDEAPTQDATEAKPLTPEPGTAPQQQRSPTEPAPEAGPSSGQSPPLPTADQATGVQGTGTPPTEAPQAARNDAFRAAGATGPEASSVGGSRGGESFAGRLGPEAEELAGQLASQLRVPGVLAALLSAAYAALAVLAVGFLLAAAFSDASVIGRVGAGVGMVTEAFRQMVQTLLADVLSTGVLQQETERVAPATLVIVPFGACAVAAATQASRTERLSPLVRLVFAAATGIPFALLMVLAALVGGSNGEIDPSVRDAFGYGLLWGALGGLAGTAPSLRRSRSRTEPDRRVRTALTVARTVLPPLGALLLVSLVIGTALVLWQTAAGPGNALGGRSQATAFVENTLYLLEHALHFAELGALVEFEAPGSLGSLGLPLPVEDVFGVTGGDRFRIFGYRRVLASYVFAPWLLVSIALTVLLALYAGFSTARRQAAPTPLLGAAWGAVVGPVWAVTMAIADAIIAGGVFGAAEGDSVFATFLLAGSVLGALGGLLGAGAVPRAGGTGARASAGTAGTSAAPPQPAPRAGSPRAAAS